ncbi:phosphoglycerate dehydrogenase [Corynebacterium sp. 153RC1]|uniref:phosphoglycerate dehydrogenase n=1 Tax=unclassified Corynebacterium TaxID=2624378 RepID=UPI00211CE9E1|nr:phosphoglycerate dehydrogenase [Corynebacterium sp. 209RC1]MCQ9353837.1 phosphoglycerate dehydrogenase [Corynebacterium sp. 1222RC1]MCQ9356868.1 phosphoglycerate dehydrogenase [Corynebacterium sp. 122RC1]MCQ9358281.1 phosphoglycerate dehydrogenase [Corynebacterium sp. 142RC1]MCQ9361336.1 phosphoglycerate dehydrogenase [Corynebacterium sp. 153RC1]MCQ9362918.1 phosphoglycerate dehydrogenase [Corynebacterium sp. 732RC1]MCQ9365882.1 phosphoglycerate dehydrogenase [Corynebacterium sp. 70RC1]MC
MSLSGRPVVLIADKLAQSTVDALGDAVEVRWVDGPNRPELLKAVADADALLVRSATTVDAEVLAAAPKLKIVGRAGVGLDNVDIPAATERGVMVANAPTSNIHSACEHAITLLLSTARQIPAADKTLRDHEWKRSSFNGVEVFGKTVGIVGFGHIGQLFAQRLAAFETTIIAYDPYANPARAAQLGVELVELEELMARADFVTIHLPKTKETAGMFNAELLAKSKPGQIIINAARGGLVDEQALADAIKEGRIRGAGFDVFETEPCTESPLFELPQVVVTPHLGASTEEAQDRAGTDVADSVLKALAGEFVADAVNVSGGRVGEEVALWLDLARKLGLLAGKLLEQAPVSLEVEARGELSSEDVEVLGLSALRGLFSGIIEEPVTFVNAPRIAQERGLDLKVTTASESPSHRSAIEVRAIAADGSSESVVGTLSGLERLEKIVRINGRGLDLRATGRNLFFNYADAPGALGKVGSALGAENINIVAAALTQESDGPGAVLILRVEQEVSEELLAAIAKDLDAEAFQLELD